MDRQEQRKKLREKIKAQRDGRTGGASSQASLSDRVRNDPTSALLGMGIDDAAMLTQAARLVNDPKALRQASRALVAPSTDRTMTPTLRETPHLECDDSDEEEAPPPL